MATPPAGAKQNGTGTNLLRGRSDRSKELIGAMFEICNEMQPITGRGVGYKLFTQGLIPSMSKNDMRPVYRLLRLAREEGTIDWRIVDETREFERTAQWDEPEDFLDCVMRQYRRDFWEQQPSRCELWSEKGTVRGVLQPVLDEYGVGFRVLHGFSGATTIHDVARDCDGRVLNVIYVGDYDPSGLYMSEVDLPRRLEQYGGDHVVIDRVAITIFDIEDLASFPASSKKKDPRFKWWTRRRSHPTCRKPETRLLACSSGLGLVLGRVMTPIPASSSSMACTALSSAEIASSGSFNGVSESGGDQSATADGVSR